MLEFFSALSRRLRRYQVALWGLVTVSTLGFIAAIFASTPLSDSSYALVAIILLLWGLSLIVVVQLFDSPAPQLREGLGYFQRLRVRLVRTLRWVVGLTTIGLFGFVILLSFKTAGLLLRG